MRHGGPGLSRTDVIAPGELDRGPESAWRTFQAADPDLRSPFFAPAFCRIVAELGDDLRIAVMSEAGEPVGFFPFHHQRFGRLARLAGQISDHHGILGTDGGLGRKPGFGR